MASTRELELCEETLRACGVLDGQPELRTKLIHDVLSWGNARNLESVCAYLQRRTRLEQLPARVLEVLRDEAAYEDVLASAELAERKSEPGRDQRASDAAARASVSAHDRTLMGSAAYSMTLHESKSAWQVCRLLPKQWPHETAESLEPQIRDLLLIGAKAALHPCPELATLLLLEGSVRALVLWHYLHRLRVLSARSPRKLTDAQASELVEAIPLERFALVLNPDARRRKENTALALEVEARRRALRLPLSIDARSLWIPELHSQRR
jgi:hypothetical protein